MQQTAKEQPLVGGGDISGHHLVMPCLLRSDLLSGVLLWDSSVLLRREMEDPGKWTMVIPLPSPGS